MWLWVIGRYRRHNGAALAERAWDVFTGVAVLQKGVEESAREIWGPLEVAGHHALQELMLKTPSVLQELDAREVTCTAEAGSWRS